MSNIRSSGPIYINLSYPDTRRKVHITFKYNDKFTKQSIIIQNEWVSMNRVIDHLKETPIIKGVFESNKERQLYLFTTDDKLVQSLTELVNDQRLLLKFEPINSAVDYTTEVAAKIITPSEKSVNNTQKSEDDMFERQFHLWEKEYVADSEFLNQCYDLKSRYPSRVEIGESYPYRARIYFSSFTDLAAWVYLVDRPGLCPEYTVYSENTQIYCALMNILKESLTDASLIDSVMEGCFEKILEIDSQQKEGNFAPYLDDDIIKIFPKDFKEAPTMTKSNIFYHIYQRESSLSSKTGVPISICKKSLLNFKDKFVDAMLALKKQYPNITPTKEKNDIRAYRFEINNELECPICFCEHDPLSAIQLSCGHSPCQQCFQQHIQSSLSEGRGNIAPIACPSFKCPNFIDSVSIATSLNSNQWRLWTKKIFEEFLMITDSKFCKTPECNRIMYTYPGISKTIPFVPCGCNKTLCACCGISAIHWPNPCREGDVSAEIWRDIASVARVLRETTLCPKCNMAIFRTEGCNHMVCKLCNYVFCYDCGSNYHRGTCVISNGQKNLNSATIATRILSLDISGSILTKMSKSNNIPFIVQFQRAFMKYKAKSEEEENVFQHIKKYLKLIATTSNGKKKNELCGELSVHIGELWDLQKGKEFKPRKLRSSIIQSSETDVWIKTLMCDISLNGYSEVVSQMFVNSSLVLFKMEIIRILNKKLVNKINFNNDSSLESQKTLRKIRLFTNDGYEILSVNDISQSEHIFVSLDGEMFITQPTDAGNPNLLDRKKQLEKIITTHFNNKESALEELIDLRTNPIYHELELSDQTISDDQAIIEALQELNEDDFDFYDDEECEDVEVFDKYSEYIENY
ncbi:hypothetical protein PPL_11475 [Heterostelium album PN500]|uniref:RBR-type E3 ubiquitin transferase n=1 Tax=Heterostelium pallidum (strain ATCC 26659 / Pp 5 / PN500) TaxID=670386 RepID=D3BTH9_HETP5|nr:hypothetical protein PPL_11475 [Heterostelium album PN500]EFA75396.1 hypothetical protein PPL_11475 [Heterostelium album PN500]|eukprot:XP_020427530.1 hypothetical protein PPL_11475 [Heterostelium album PN500]